MLELNEINRMIQISDRVLIRGRRGLGHDSIIEDRVREVTIVAFIHYSEERRFKIVSICTFIFLQVERE